MKIPNWISFLAIAGALGIGGYMYYQRSDTIAQHDRIVSELVKNERYAEAIEALEALKAGAPVDHHDGINTTLASCYCNHAASLPAKDRVAWYLKADAIKPGCLTEQQQSDVDTFGG